MNKLSHALLLDEIATALKRPTPDNRTDRELGTNLLSLIATRLSDVTPEMVEAAAEAICALHEDLERTPWSEWADSVRDRYRTDARAALSVIPEAAEWEADAARYRWLRSRDLDTTDAGGIFIGRVPENTVINGEDADRAIDAAISPRIKDNANG